VPDGETIATLLGDVVEVPLSQLGDDADFGGAQIVDLADGVSAFAYTGEDFINEGGLVLFDDVGDLEVDRLIGGFGLGVDAEGYPLHTSLGPLLDDADEAGLYGTILCDADGLLCGSFPYDQWGDSTGPMAVDADGNVFAVMTSFDGTQNARGFGATQIQLAEPTVGTDFFTIDGFGTPLAALAPTIDGDEGLLVYQATDAETFAQDPAIVVAYAAGDGIVAPSGEPETLLTPTGVGAPVSLMTDDQERIWVGVGTKGGTRFAVLARP
jgi:hypothetical protein